MTSEDGKLLAAFTAYWRSMGYAPKTVENYCRDLRLLATHQALSECSTLDLHAFLDERSGEVARGTLSVTVRGLRAFYRWRSEALDCADPGGAGRATGP